MFNRLISAWQQVVKRSLAHWRLLSSVVLGVLLASAIMAGTVIYFDALRDLSLKNTFGQHSKTELDILIKGEMGAVTVEEYNRVSKLAADEIDYRVAWMVPSPITTAGKTQTFFLSRPGMEDDAGGDNARSYFFFMPQLPEHVTFVDGAMPREGLLNAPGDPPELEAAIPRDAADLFGVGVGDRLSAVPPWEDFVPHVSVVISGVYERNDPGAEFWYLENEELKAATGPTFRTVPFHISQRTFLEVLGPAFRKMEGLFAWHVPVDTERVNAHNAELTLFHVERMHSTLATALSNFHQTTALESSLREYDRRLFFNKLPMFVVLTLIAVVILYYVTTLSSLVVEDRRGEVALLRSRGASSVQILTVFVLEGSTIAVLAVATGPLLAAGAISMLGYTPAFSDLSGGARLEVTISGGAYFMSAIGGLLSFAALIIPAIQASRIGVTRHRQEASRPSSQPAFQRYYVDVLLLVLAIFLFRQLTEQGSVVATELFGDVAVNQILLALPGLVLVASAMVLLRLFPLVMNLASRTMSTWLPAGPVLGVWQMARNPTHYARLSLLLILTAGLGIFASSFGATLELSFEQRVLFSTGSDIRVDGVRPFFNPRPPFVSRSRRGGNFEEPTPVERPTIVEAYEMVPGVEKVSPVLTSSGRDLTKTFGESYTMMAVDSDSFGEVAWFREDFADEPMEELLASLKVTNMPQGIVLPADGRTIAVRARPDRPHPTIRITARIKDAKDRYSTYFLGTLRSGDWSTLETSLTTSDGLRLRQPDQPLELVSLRVHEVGGSADIGRRLQAGSLLIDDILVTTASGDTVVIEPFDSAAGWNVLREAAESRADVLRESDDGSGDGAGVLFSWSQGGALTARGIYAGESSPVLPVLATRPFLEKTGRSEGEELEVSVAGFRIPVRIEETIDLFPTVTSQDKNVLVSDLTSLTRYANLSAIDRELLPNGVWLTASDNGQRAETIQALGEVERFSSTVIHDRAARLARSQVDPLVEAGWRSLLFIAFGAVLLLSCLGFLVHAYVSFRNRQLQFALLRTVGFSIRQLTAMVWLEQMLVIAAGMALGTWMGGRLGAIIMPFLGHDDWGTRVMPPFVMQVNWGALLITYSFMVLVFAVITLGLIWLIHRISLQRTLRLGEM